MANKEKKWRDLFPMTVSEIVSSGEKACKGSRNAGKFVQIRPCNKEINPKGDTFLGLYLGELAISVNASYDETEQKLTIGMGMHNPAIFVFGISTIVFGCESWWKVIKSEEDLQQITNTDIDNIWYAKALKELASEVSFTE